MKRNTLLNLVLFGFASVFLVISCNSGNNVGEDSVDPTSLIETPANEISEETSTDKNEFSLIEEEKYTMSYPSNWNLQKYEGEVSFSLTTDMYSKDETMNDNVSLMAVSNPEDKLKIHDEVFMELYKEEMKAKIPGMQFSVSELKTIEGREYYHLEYSFEQGENMNKIQQRYFVGDSSDFYITYISRKDSYDENVAKAEVAMNTFMLK